MPGPYFITDIASVDGVALPDFDKVAADPRFVGVILKATQGTNFAPHWFLDNWPRVRASGKARPQTWWPGAYHFLTPGHGAAQADAFLKHVAYAGGFHVGDILPICDVEGSAWSSAQQVIDSCSPWSARIKQELGLDSILYAGALIRDFAIKDHMGFKTLWSPHVTGMEQAGWDKLGLWQYAGTNPKPPGVAYYDPNSVAAKLQYPLLVDGYTPSDMSVCMGANGNIGMDLDEVRLILTGKS